MPCHYIPLLLLLRQILLHHPTNLPIRLELRPNTALLVKRPSDLLGRATDRAIRVEHLPDAAVFGEYAGAGPVCEDD